MKNNKLSYFLLGSEQSEESEVERRADKSSHLCMYGYGLIGEFNVWPGGEDEHVVVCYLR